MRGKFLGLSLLAACCVATAHAADGVHISFVEGTGQPASQLYVSGHKVRVDSGGAHKGSMLYDATNHTLTLLMPKKHAYLVLDKHSATELGAKMQDAQKQMQAQMAKMPPQQRAMVEKMLAQNGMTDGKIKVEIKDLGSSETIAGYRCRDMQITRGKQTSFTMCVTPLKSLGLPASTINTLDMMRGDMKHLLASLGPMAEAYSTLQNVDGFAIKREVPHREGFKLTTVTEMLQSVKSGNQPAKLFVIPAGYTQTSVDKMMHEGG